MFFVVIFLPLSPGSVIDLDLFQQPTLQFNQPSCFIIAYLPKVWLKVAGVVMMWALPTGQDKKMYWALPQPEAEFPLNPFCLTSSSHHSFYLCRN